MEQTLLRARVGDVRQIVRGGLAADPQIDDAGFDHDAGVVGVDAQDPAQPRQHDQHPVGHGQRPAGQAGAGAPGHEGDACFGAQPNRVDHVLRALGQHDDAR